MSVFLGLIPATIAYNKGRNILNWWIYGTFLFIIAAIHSVILKPTEAVLLQEGMRKCPFCAEIVKPDAVVCRYCGRDLPEVKKSFSPYHNVD